VIGVHEPHPQGLMEVTEKRHVRSDCSTDRLFPPPRLPSPRLITLQWPLGVQVKEESQVSL